VPVKIFLRNLTDKNITIYCFTNSNSIPKILYSNSLEEITYSKDEMMENELIPESNNNGYKFTIPQSSTVYLEKGLNYQFIKFEKIIIENIDTLTLDNLDKFKTKSQGFPVKRWMWYEIK
jgi:hypothetical protein